MSLKKAAKCLEANADRLPHVHSISLPKRFMRRTPASRGIQGLEKAARKFKRYMNRLEENEQHLLRAKENKARYFYNLSHVYGCKRYTEDAEPYFTKQEWLQECASARLQKLNLPQERRKTYVYY